MKPQYVIFILLTVFCFACKPTDKDQSKNNNTDIPQQTSYTNEMIGEIITSVPNPLEMSSLLRKSGVIYNNELLNPANNINRYNNEIRKALALGIYGTDIIHMTIYKQLAGAPEYLENINKLANELKMNEQFKFKELSQLIKEAKNPDSILFLINLSYDRMNMAMIESGKSGNSVLMSYATWIESLYLATNIKKVTNVEGVYSRIGEQKNVLDNLYTLLSHFNNQKEFRELLIDLQLLKSEFDKVLITYQYRPPTTQEINGNLVIIDNSTSVININEQNVVEIAKIVAIIRNKIIS